MKLPPEILSEFEKLIDGLQGFGVASISVTLHDNHPKFSLESKRNIVPGKKTSGTEANNVSG